MPTINKPKRIKKTDDGNRYAEERRRIYATTRWRKLREWKMISDPLCEMCSQQGKVTPAEDVHHIKSFMSVDDKTERLRLAYDYNNLMSLCKVCHQMIHNKK